MQDYIGYRTRKRQEKKRKRGKFWRVLVILALLFVVFVVLGAAFKISPFKDAWQKAADGFEWLGRKIKGLWPWKARERIEPARFLPEGQKTANYLVGITKSYGNETALSYVVLVSYDSRDESVSLIYLPTDLLVDVPGIGMDSLSNLVQLDEGRFSKTIVALENLLGIQVDRYILMSDHDLSILFNKLGPYTVVVAERLKYEDKSLDVSVNLAQGSNELKGPELASYLTYAAPGMEMKLIERLRDFAPVFFEKSRGSDYKNIVSFVEKNSDLVESDASSRELAGLWQTLALVKEGLLKQVVLPVKPFRMEKTVAHRVDQGKLPGFIRKYLKPAGGEKESGRVRVEVLNGCGVPGIGEKVASQISLDRFKIVNNANADNFNYGESVIIVYSEDRNTTSAAEELRNELEAGRLEAHPRNQDVTDITVIVGKDYASK